MSAIAAGIPIVSRCSGPSTRCRTSSDRSNSAVLGELSRLAQPMGGILERIERKGMLRAQGSAAHLEDVVNQRTRSLMFANAAEHVSQAVHGIDRGRVLRAQHPPPRVEDTLEEYPGFVEIVVIACQESEEVQRRERVGVLRNPAPAAVSRKTCSNKACACFHFPASR